MRYSYKNPLLAFSPKETNDSALLTTVTTFDSDRPPTSVIVTKTYKLGKCLSPSSVFVFKLKSYDLVYQNIAYRRVYTNVLRVHDRLPEGLFLSETQAAQDAIWTAQRNHITSKITNDSVNSFSEWMILKYAGSRTKRWSFYFHAIKTEWKIYIQWPTVAYFRARQKIRPDTEILESFMELEKSAAPVFILEIGRSADWLLTYHISATTR